MCKLAVEQDGYNLKYVYNQTPEICKIAIQLNADALRFIPDNNKTHELCIMAVQKCGLVLGYIPKNLLTDEILMEAVIQDGRSLKYIDVDKQTEELCMIAIQQHPYAINYAIYNNQYYKKINVTDDDCLICFDNSGTWCKLHVCGHKFHINCIETCLTTSNKCPLCLQIVK